MTPSTIKQFELSLTTQGDTGAASRVHIEAQDADGVKVPENFQVRVRVCNEDTFDDSTNATIAGALSTVTDESITSTKDIIVSPAIGVAASRLLTLTGVVIHGEYFTIHGRRYGFSTIAATKANVLDDVIVDISAHATKSQGKLTMLTQPTVGDQIVVNGQAYTFVPEAAANAQGEIGIGGVSVAEITDITVVGGSVAQIETFTTVADASDSLDGKYLQLSDEDGTVGFWIDTDNSGTAEPAGSAALDRSVEITTIATDDTDETVATLVAAAINADSKFSAAAVGAVVTVTHATAGAVADGADGAAPTGFTSFTVTTNGTSHALDGKYFILQDTAGTVAFWIDTDNSGTTIPAGASAADRAVEITTVNAVDTTNTIATAIAAKINADSQFASTATNAVMTVTNAEVGQFGAAADGDTGFTPFTITTAGVSASAQDNVVAAINGTDGFNVADPDVTIAAFVDNDAIITAKVGGVAGDLIVTTETFASGNNFFDAATLGTETAGVDATAANVDGVIITVVAADTGAIVTPTQGGGTTVLFTANSIGTWYNSVILSEDMANASWASGTLTGGAEANPGEVDIDLTDATVESVTLRLGIAPQGSIPADYTDKLTVAHAAP